MADIHELDPGVTTLRESLERRSVCARYLFAAIDGTTHNDDIAEQLTAAGVYTNKKTSVVMLSIMKRDVNKFAVETWGEPLITKQTTQSAFSCNPALAEQFIQLRYSLLPMDMSDVDPTVFMDEQSAELYRSNCGRYDEFKARLDRISSSLDSPEFTKELIAEAENGEKVFLPRKDLVRLYAACRADDTAYRGILSKTERGELRLNSTNARALNLAANSLVGQDVICIEKVGRQGSVRIEYEIDHGVLALLVATGTEAAKLPNFDFAAEDIDQLEASISRVNEFLMGKVRELGFLESCTIRDTLLLRDMLEGLEIDNDPVMQKRSQALIVMNRRLAAWNVVRGMDRNISRVARELAVTEKPAGASCKGVNAELFFPERGASTREAKEVCRGCICREQCLELSLQNNEKFGIWGGLSERERRRIRRQRSIERKKTRLQLVEVPHNDTVTDDEDSEQEFSLAAGS